MNTKPRPIDTREPFIVYEPSKEYMRAIDADDRDQVRHPYRGKVLAIGLGYGSDLFFHDLTKLPGGDNITLNSVNRSKKTILCERLEPEEYNTLLGKLDFSEVIGVDDPEK